MMLLEKRKTMTFLHGLFAEIVIDAVDLLFRSGPGFNS